MEKDKELQLQKNAIMQVIMPAIRGLNVPDVYKEAVIRSVISQELNPITDVYFLPFMQWVKDEKGNRVPSGEYNIAVVHRYERYIRRAEMSPNYGGFEYKFEGEEFAEDGTPIHLNETPAWVFIKVRYKDGRPEFQHTITMKQAYNKKNDKNWNEDPRGMLLKTGLARTFRLAFPLEYKDAPVDEYNYREMEKTEEFAMPTEIPTTPSEMLGDHKEDEKSFEDTPEDNAVESESLLDESKKAFFVNLKAYAESKGWEEKDTHTNFLKFINERSTKKKHSDLDKMSKQEYDKWATSLKKYLSK